MHGYQVTLRTVDTVDFVGPAAVAMGKERWESLAESHANEAFFYLWKLHQVFPDSDSATPSPRSDKVTAQVSIKLSLDNAYMSFWY